MNIRFGQNVFYMWTKYAKMHRNAEILSIFMNNINFQAHFVKQVKITPVQLKCKFYGLLCCVSFKEPRL